VTAFVGGGVEELAGVGEVDPLDVQTGLVARALPSFVVEARRAGGEAGG
jgi:hypothetical protein